jgi:hypothetical protein
MDDNPTEIRTVYLPKPACSVTNMLSLPQPESCDKEDKAILTVYERLGLCSRQEHWDLSIYSHGYGSQ